MQHNTQEPNIRQTPAPYPYIANAQEPNIRQQTAISIYLQMRVLTLMIQDNH